MNKAVEKTFIVHNVPDYNTMIALIKEMRGAILRVTTSSSNMANSETIKIYTSGDKNHLLFAEYLFKKYKQKLEEMKKGLKISV